MTDRTELAEKGEECCKGGGAVASRLHTLATAAADAGTTEHAAAVSECAGAATSPRAGSLTFDRALAAAVQALKDATVSAVTAPDAARIYLHLAGEWRAIAQLLAS